MAAKLEKIFNPYTLLVLNIAIILAAVLVGNGQYFFESGAIHAIAVFFILLAITRIFVHYYTFDPVLEKLLHASLLALLVFAASHVVEFFSYKIFNAYEDAIFANVANLYIASLAFMSIGAEAFLRRYKQQSPLLINLLLLAVVILGLITAAFLVKDAMISLEPNSPSPYLYAIVVIAISAIGLYKIWSIKKLVPVTAGFANYLTASVILIILATLPNIFYEVLGDAFGLSEIMIIYLSHFTFYAALSVMFLAFRKLSYLGTLYEELKMVKKNDSVRT